MRPLLLASCLMLTTSAARGDERDAIGAELQREAAAWNRGDLDGYLAGYERAPTTLFVGATQIYRGWDAIAAMYRKGHPDAARMGQVGFADVEIKLLDGNFALVLGRWKLSRSAAAGGDAGGFFTLTMHKGAAGWRITVDHTS